MKKDILDKLELKNTENLSAHKFDNKFNEDINNDFEKMKVNDDFTNEDTLSNGIVDGFKYCKEEESKLKHQKEIDVEMIPTFPNLGE